MGGGRPDADGQAPPHEADDLADIFAALSVQVNKLRGNSNIIAAVPPLVEPSQINT